MNTLCIIPARGGSKRIPYKNIKSFYGKPIIQYALQEAMLSECFSEIVVSTDDILIAKASNPARIHWRSNDNASDSAVLADVLIEVLASPGLNYHHAEYFCCLLPTAALITSGHIRSAMETLRINPDASEVMPVVRYGYPVERSVKLSNGSWVKMVHPEHQNTLSNHLTPTYHDAGQFYWFRTADFLAEPKIIMDRCIGYELLEREVQDIDTEEDWLLAELKYGQVLQNRPGQAVRP